MPTNEGYSQSETHKLINAINEHPSVIRSYREGNLFGMSIGALVLIGGFVMFTMGLSGSIEWLFEAGTIKAKLANASPGAVFSAVGLVIMLRYKPRVRTEIEISVNKSYEKNNPDNITSETKVRVSNVASSPITSRPPGRQW